MGEYILMNPNIQNKIQTELIERFTFNIICFMNIYWGYRIYKF